MEKILLSKPKISIVNVVASGSLKHGIDLNAIVNAFPKVEYRPQVFPGLVFKLKRPKTATLIFNTGKMVCTGAKSVKEARRAIRKVVRELKREGIIITGKPEIKIQNIVASIDLGMSIDVEECIFAVSCLGKQVMYEPDQFPGAIYRMEEPRCVFLIFSTGKLVCVGTTREADVYKAVENLVTILDDAEVLVRKEGRSGLAKSLRDRILEALKKESLSALELSERLGMKTNYFLSKLEEEGLIEYDFVTDKWHLKRG